MKRKIIFSVTLVLAIFIVSNCGRNTQATSTSSNMPSPSDKPVPTMLPPLTQTAQSLNIVSIPLALIKQVRRDLDSHIDEGITFGPMLVYWQDSVICFMDDKFTESCDPLLHSIDQRLRHEYKMFYWSPEGKKIAYLTDTNGHTRNTLCIYDIGTRTTGPCTSSDNKKLLYWWDSDGLTYYEEICDGCIGDYKLWSPFNGEHNPDYAPIPNTFNPNPTEPFHAFFLTDMIYDRSLNGRYIHQHNERIPDTGKNIATWEILDGSNHLLFDFTGLISDIHLSKDGKYVAYDDILSASLKFQNIDTGKSSSLLLANPGWSWSPNGRLLLASTATDIYIIDPDTNQFYAKSWKDLGYTDEQRNVNVRIGYGWLNNYIVIYIGDNVSIYSLKL